MRKSKHSRDTSQSDVTDYASSTSLSVKDPIQMMNPLHKQVIYM